MLFMISFEIDGIDSDIGRLFFSSPNILLANLFNFKPGIDISLDNIDSCVDSSVNAEPPLAKLRVGLSHLAISL